MADSHVKMSVFNFLKLRADDTEHGVRMTDYQTQLALLRSTSDDCSIDGGVVHEGTSEDTSAGDRSREFIS